MAKKKAAERTLQVITQEGLTKSHSTDSAEHLFAPMSRSAGLRTSDANMVVVGNVYYVVRERSTEAEPVHLSFLVERCAELQRRQREKEEQIEELREALALLEHRESVRESMLLSRRSLSSGWATKDDAETTDI